MASECTTEPSASLWVGRLSLFAWWGEQSRLLSKSEGGDPAYSDDSPAA